MAERRSSGDGSVFKRANGKWITKVDRYVNGKRVFTERVSNTEGEAKAKLKLLLKAKEEGIAPDADKLRLEPYLKDWLQSVKKELKPRSYERYDDIIRLHLAPALGREFLVRLTAPRIDAYLREKLESGLAPGTVGGHHAVLRAALNQAMRWGLLSRNPASLVKAPRKVVYEPKWLRPDEAIRFLEAAKGDRYEALYLLAVLLGAREGEILGLTWKDIDFTVGEVRLWKNLQRNPQNGNKLELQDTKARKSRRTLPLPEILTAALRQRKADQAQDRLLVGPDRWTESGLAFTTRYGTPIRAANLLKSFKRLLVRAGLEERRFHDLRHSCASFLLVLNVPMKVVSEILGHGDMAMTSEIYSHVLPAVRKEAIEGVSRFLGVSEGEASGEARRA